MSADPAVLGKLYQDADAWAKAAFPPFGDSTVGRGFVPALEMGATPDQILGWYKEYWSNVKGNGYTPYAVNTMLHDNGDSCERYILGRLSGVTYGSPVEETQADRQKQITHINQMLAMKLAVPQTDPAYDPGGIENCYRMLAALATKPLYKAGN